MVAERLVDVDKLIVGYQWLSAPGFRTLGLGEMATPRRRPVFDLDHFSAAGCEQPNGGLNIGRIALKPNNGET